VAVQKLAAIPPSAFFSDQHKAGNDHFIRLCFFKVYLLFLISLRFLFQKDETLAAAEKILEHMKKAN
jgi:hypothetical protein